MHLLGVLLRVHHTRRRSLLLVLEGLIRRTCDSERGVLTLHHAATSAGTFAATFAAARHTAPS